MKVWITKYVLTSGIAEREVTQCIGINEHMVSVIGRPSEHYHGDDWHRDRASAVAKAETMRAKKIDSLKRQIAKLEALSFAPGTAAQP